MYRARKLPEEAFEWVQTFRRPTSKQTPFASRKTDSSTRAIPYRPSDIDPKANGTASCSIPGVKMHPALNYNNNETLRKTMSHPLRGQQPGERIKQSSTYCRSRHYQILCKERQPMNELTHYVPCCCDPAYVFQRVCFHHDGIFTLSTTETSLQRGKDGVSSLHILNW